MDDALSRQLVAKYGSLGVKSSRKMRDLITLMARMTISPIVLSEIDWLKRKIFYQDIGLLNNLIITWLEMLMDYFLAVDCMFRMYQSILDSVARFFMKHIHLDVMYILTLQRCIMMSIDLIGGLD